MPRLEGVVTQVMLIYLLYFPECVSSFSLLYLSVIIPHLASLAIVMVFPYTDSCLNGCFWEGQVLEIPILHLADVSHFSYC